MKHHRLAAWEKKLRQVMDGIDDYLEDKYGKTYPLHPARARRGATANRRHDGLFSVEAAFTAGFGSKLGRGYMVRIRMATLRKVPADIREKIEKEAAAKLRKALPTVFPDRKLTVKRAGREFKICGDLSLGRL